MRYFPVFLDLEGCRVVVAGGGESAAQKTRLLLKTTAEIFVIAEEICDEIEGYFTSGRLVLVRRAPITDDLSGAVLAYAATGEPLADAAFAALAKAAGTPVNAVDRPEISDFITPALVDRDPVTVAIGTEGSAPVLARAIKSEIEALLPTSTGAIARLAAAWRLTLAARVPQARSRRRIWQRFFASRLPDGEGAVMLRAADIRLEALTTAELVLGQGAGAVSRIVTGGRSAARLSGADRRRLHDADVVAYHLPLNRPVLELARREAKFIVLSPAQGHSRRLEGGSAGAAEAASSPVEDILAAEAAKGQRVVHLINAAAEPGVPGRRCRRAVRLEHREKETR